MDEYHQYAGVAKTIGVDVKFLTPQQVKEIWPLCHTDDLIGAIQHPEDGIRDRLMSRGLGDVYKRQSMQLIFIKH